MWSCLDGWFIPLTKPSFLMMILTQHGSTPSVLHGNNQTIKHGVYRFFLFILSLTSICWSSLITLCVLTFTLIMCSFFVSDPCVAPDSGFYIVMNNFVWVKFSRSKTWHLSVLVLELGNWPFSRCFPSLYFERLHAVYNPNLAPV